MPAVHPDELETCPNCGHCDGGNFCSRCGSPLDAPTEGLLSVAAADIFGSGSGDGFFATLRRLLRRPVLGTLALVEEPLYRNHGSFLLSATTIYMLVMGWVMTQQATIVEQLVRKEGFVESAVEAIKQFVKIVQGVFFPVFVYLALTTIGVLGYYVFRRLSHRQVEPRKYVKLASLAWGVTLMLLTLGNIGYYVLVRRTGERAISSRGSFLEALMPADTMEFGLVGLAVFMLFAVLVYVFMVNRRFWRIGFGRMLVGFAAVGIGSMVVSALATVALLLVAVPLILILA